MTWSMGFAAEVRWAKPRELRGRDLAMVHVHASEFGAAMQCGHSLARIEQAMSVERLLDAMEQRQLIRCELHAHLVDLFDANAMLAGDRTAECDRPLQNLGAERLGALELAGHVGVEQDQRMHVPVAGVE